jgi:hypothetical protein
MSLDALRGKTVLLHFWSPRSAIREIASLKAVHDRFGKDGRFTMIGLCLTEDVDAATRVIKLSGLSWSHAVLRDGAVDAIALDYGANHSSASFLIGRDGKLITKLVEGPLLEKVVADAVSNK